MCLTFSSGHYVYHLHNVITHSVLSYQSQNKTIISFENINRLACVMGQFSARYAHALLARTLNAELVQSTVQHVVTGRWGKATGV